MKLKRSNLQMSHPDLIPMIDIVFQLILFFLVATTFAVLPGIRVQLPVSQTAENTASVGLTITAHADGTLWLNGEDVTMESLDAQLTAYDTGDIERNAYPVRLEADGQVTNSVIVSLFDILRMNGFAAVNLRTTEE